MPVRHLTLTPLPTIHLQASAGHDELGGVKSLVQLEMMYLKEKLTNWIEL